MAGLTRYAPPFAKGFYPIDKCSGGGAGGGSVISRRPCYQLDSIDDQIVLAEDYALDATPIEIRFLGGTDWGGSYGRFFKNEENYDVSVDTDLDSKKFRLTGCTAVLNGAPVVSSVTPIPTTGANVLIVTILPSNYGKILRRFGAALVSGRPEKYIKGTLTHIKIGAVVNLPLDDGHTAGNVLLNTGSGGNAEGRNFNSGGWYECDII